MKVDAVNITIKNLLTRGKYIIPDYQREYDWEDEQIEELLEDLEECKVGDNYFIGHMVFEGERNGDRFVVIDGQQRITTITIMLCCLRDVFYDRNEKDLAEGINDRYIFSKDDNNKLFARLYNDMPYPVLQARVQNIPTNKDVDIHPQKDGEKKIVEAYDKLYTYYKSKTTQELQDCRTKILDLETVSVVAEGVANASTIFMTLNATGKDLSPMDLVKSLIFSNYPVVPLLNEPNDTWKRILSNINQKGNFLNNFYASRYKKVSDMRLFKEIEKTIKQINPNDIHEATKDFLNQMEEDSKIFKLIVSPSMSQWKQSDYDIYESIFALTTQFKIKVANSFLIALLRDFFKKEISKKILMKMLKTMEQIHFVNNAICSSRSSGMDKLYSKYAHALYEIDGKQGKHILIKEFCKELLNKKSNKSTFDAKIDSKLYYTKKDERQKDLVKYVLRKIERVKNRHAIPIETSIEHIYPENSREEQLEDASLIKNIGNLVLLENDVNSDIGNKPYKQKKEYVLKHSKMLSAKEVFEKNNEWGDEQIKGRRNDLLDVLYDSMWIK